MIEGRPPPHRLSDRLGFRLGLVLSMALLPVGLIAVIQSNKVLNEAQARSEAALVGETLRAVAPSMRLVRQAQGAAAAVGATMLPVLTEPDPTCDSVLRSLVVPGSMFQTADYVDRSGRVLCSADPARPGPPSQLLDQLRATDQPLLTSLPPGAPGALPIVQTAYPVKDASEQVIGTVLLSVSPKVLQDASFALSPRKDLAVVVFNEDGAVLTANRPMDDLKALLPSNSDLSALARHGETIFTGPSVSGEARAFSIVSLVDTGIFALGSWPAADSAISGLPMLPAAAFPALMWAVSLVAAFVAAELLVTRHIRDLRAAIMRFARGHRAATELDMSLAPGEIRDASEAFVQMTHTILRDEAELEHSLHQKEVLLREVHHRVKNNLQLIASIISMQMRETSSGEARQLMRAVQDRVISLATVHKDLYLTSDLTEVRAKDLLPDIVSQVITLGSGPGGEIDVHAAFADVALTPDQAVPLALLLAEAVTHARNEALEESAVPQLSVTMDTEGPDRAILVVSHKIEPTALKEPGAQMRTGLGRQLIDAFAAQLEGEVQFKETPDSHRMELRFPLSAAAEWPARAPDTTNAAHPQILTPKREQIGPHRVSIGNDVSKR